MYSEPASKLNGDVNSYFTYCAPPVLPSQGSTGETPVKTTIYSDMRDQKRRCGPSSRLAKLYSFLYYYNAHQIAGSRRDKSCQSRARQRPILPITVRQILAVTSRKEAIGGRHRNISALMATAGLKFEGRSGWRASYHHSTVNGFVASMDKIDESRKKKRQLNKLRPAFLKAIADFQCLAVRNARAGEPCENMPFYGEP